MLVPSRSLILSSAAFSETGKRNGNVATLVVMVNSSLNPNRPHELIFLSASPGLINAMPTFVFPIPCHPENPRVWGEGSAFGAASIRTNAGCPIQALLGWEKLVTANLKHFSR
jgi:hypothetical protein